MKTKDYVGPLQLTNDISVRTEERSELAHKEEMHSQWYELLGSVVKCKLLAT